MEYAPDRLGFAQRLEELLAARGESKYWLAQASGYSPSAVSAWVNGRAGELKVSTLLTLEQVLEVEPGTLCQFFGIVPISKRGVPLSRVKPTADSIRQEFRDWPAVRDALLAHYRVSRAFVDSQQQED